MKYTEQGVLFKNRLLNLLLDTRSLSLFILSLFILAYTITSEATPGAKTESVAKPEKHRVLVVHSPNNKIHLSIIKSLKGEFDKTNSDYVILSVTPQENIITLDKNKDIVVSIGHENIESTNNQYTDTVKLFLLAEPLIHKPNIETNKQDAILYMAQPYCRQLKFIHAINNNWNRVSILSSQYKNIYKNKLDRCANKFGLKLYIVEAGKNRNISRNIKDALSNSDVLLALPDKNIYNRKTVKNILLTSYRYRKPVIAFSGNFVKAGALASIHSSPEQIAQSVSVLINNYFNSKNKFEAAINYPYFYDVSVNSQVFKALSLPVPNVEKLKQELVHKASEESGYSK